MYINNINRLHWSTMEYPVVIPPFCIIPPFCTISSLYTIPPPYFTSNIPPFCTIPTSYIASNIPNLSNIINYNNNYTLAEQFEQYNRAVDYLVSQATDIMVNIPSIPTEREIIGTQYLVSLHKNIDDVSILALETFRRYIICTSYLRMVDILASFLHCTMSGENALFPMHYEQLIAVCRSELFDILHRQMYRREEPIVDVMCIMEQSYIDIHHPKIVHIGDGDAEGEKCVICLEQIANGNDKRILTTCSHVFHVECIDPWLTGKSNKCPLCRVSAGLLYLDHEVDN